MRGVGYGINTNLLNTVGEVCEQAKLLYDLSPLSKSTLLSFHKNAEFLIEDKKNGFYTLMRISPPGLASKSEIESEISWLRELSKQGLPIMFPDVISGIDGGAVQEVRLPEGGLYCCVLFSYLRGRPLTDTDEKELVPNFVKLGEATALLHQNAIQWDGAQNLTRRSWNYDTMVGKFPCFSAVPQGAGGIEITSAQCKLFDRAAEKMERRLTDFGKSGARFGLIHAGLSMANVFYYKNRLAVTHFDGCGYGWFLFDYAASASSFAEDERLPLLTAAWLEGYRRQRNISNDETQEMPTFLLLHAMGLLCRLLESPEGELLPAAGNDIIGKTEALAKKFLRR